MRLRPLLALSLALGLLAAAAPAGATHRWATYHWARTSNPFTLKLLDSLTPAWDPYLGPVAADWAASNVLDTKVVLADSGSKFRKRCPVPSGRVRVCNALYGSTGWLGIAEIWLSGSHITQARVKMNDTYYRLSQYNNPAARRHVLCQEVGHVLGLDHQYDVTCMNDVAGISDPAYQSPNLHDLAELEIIYGHNDSGSTVGARDGGGTVRVSHHHGVTKIRWVFAVPKAA